MENKTFEELAKKLGIGQATVSRAVRHCPGVDSKTRQRILEEAVRAGVGPSPGPCDVYCVLPENPQYFWQFYSRAVQDRMRERQISVKNNIYSRITDQDTVLLYLEEAERLRARVLVLSACVTPKIRERLIGLQKSGMGVILLSEYAEIPDCVYVGADPFRDGEQFGLWLYRHYPRATPAVLQSGMSDNIRLRIRGFLHALEQRRPASAPEIPVIPVSNEDLSNPKTIPARLASLFGRVGEENSCIYMPFGNPRLPLSVLKAGLKERVPVLLGHDCFPKTGPGAAYPGFTACCNQDIAGQVDAAMETAEAFLEHPASPDGQIFRTIPSAIIEGAPEEQGAE